MAHKTSKSAGWSFKPPRQELNLIQYTCQVEPLDVQLLNHLREQAQNTDDLSVLFNILPPVEQLVSEIPYTLPLLEAIYLKCELRTVEDGLILPTKELCCEQLFCQLVWWTAFCEQSNSSLKKHCAMFAEFQPCIATLMSIVGRQCPDLVKRAREDRNQLKTCLESLGCHGLVNCSSGLIRMTDAVHLELLKHVENLKIICSQIKELQHDPKSNAPDPSCESHQRQMSMRLSQVFERLKLNETLQCVLEETFQNQHLGSLLRICRKRVGSDKLLIGLFNAFARAAPEDFALQQMDPIVAQLIVVFNNSYNKLLQMCPDDVSSTRLSSGSSTSSVSQGASSINEKFSVRPSENSIQFDSLKQEISKLRKELRVANYTITQLREKSEEDSVIKESSLPLPDYPDATAYYNSATKEQTSQLVTRFGELFIFASNELRDSLDTLPEMEGEDDLQAIFGHETLILTYNVVKEHIEDRKLAVLKALGSVNNNAKESNELTMFEDALSSQLHKEFTTTKAGGHIAEDLCQQVFKKLDEYPGVEECLTIHQYIQKCISISWDIQCCPERKLKLEYDGAEFEPSRHSRGAYSGTTNQVVNFIWPALIDTSDNRVLLKAIVLT
ncbi:Mitochondria-eating protein [Caenorhabditis elegans]|uniref:Mitochondria-eating protein n=1 Tax=Caenorhabditis elegans TaxID=6239 RepID=A0A4V6M500_CAEEL|nr:Mitochondria-eating protein [Caenorhabditis elegans]VTW47581.1 Mitochondria-eating protein [Caenorhabditis elegans]